MWRQLLRCGVYGGVTAFAAMVCLWLSPTERRYRANRRKRSAKQV